MGRRAICAAALAIMGAAGAARAEPAYAPAVPQAFKDVCMTALATGQSVGSLALAKGWKPSSTVQPASGTTQSHTWVSPTTARLFVADHLINGGLCEAGYYGGAAKSDKPGLDKQMEAAGEATTHALVPMGWKKTGDDGQLLVLSIFHTSAAYPDKQAVVWVSNFGSGPTLSIYLGPKF